MTRILLTLAVLIPSTVLLAACAGSARADHDPEAAVGVALRWQDTATLVVEADGFAPDEMVLVGVEVTHEQASREDHGGSIRHLSQQSRQQLTATVTADAEGVVVHTLTLVAPADSPVSVSLTDQAGHARAATTAVPRP